MKMVRFQKLWMISFMCCSFLMMFQLNATAQRKKTTTTTFVTNEVKRTNPDSTFKNLKWRNIGPFRGGRANSISGVINNNKKYNKLFLSVN